jgi:hypothetical protein
MILRLDVPPRKRSNSVVSLFMLRTEIQY